MPAGSPSKVVAPAVPPLDDGLVRQLVWLDLSTVQLAFAAHHYASLGAIWDLSIEYRRFLLLRLAYPGLDIPAPPLIDIYWRLHAADHDRFASDCAQLTSHTGLSPDRLAPPPRSLRLAPGPEIRELYETTFPSGEPELWGWPALEPEQRLRAPALGPIHIRLDSAIDEPTRARLREEALERRWHVFGAHAASSGVGESGAGMKIIDCIPHHRAPRERPTDTVVLSQFYGLLLPPRVEQAAS